jgi:hypothetical protein
MSKLINKRFGQVKGKSVPRPTGSLRMRLTGPLGWYMSIMTYGENDITFEGWEDPSGGGGLFQETRRQSIVLRRAQPAHLPGPHRRHLKAMVRNPQTAVLKEAPEEHSLPGALWQSRVEDDIRLDLMFLYEFNRNLDRNAQLSRLNENYLEQRMAELDAHRPICMEVYEYTRARLHELLLLCAANYANNCEYEAVGDLMFNPRLTLVHIRGCHKPVVKVRHTPLSEQFGDRANTPAGVVRWIRDETTLEIKEKPLIPYSYEILENAAFIPQEYLDSAQDRTVQIADLSALLCCRRFEERLDLENWLRSAGPNDRALMESRLLRLDWGMFRELGSLIDRSCGPEFAIPPFLID